MTENADGSVTYNKSDGGSYIFEPDGNGGYTAPPGVYLTLTKSSPGNYMIADKYNNRYYYQNDLPYQFMDRNNNTTTFNYNSSGQLTSVSDPSGRTLTYAYSNGNITSVADPAGHQYQFVYANGMITSITDPGNNTCSVSYDVYGHVNAFTDPLNRVTTFNISPAGQIQSIDDARSTPGSVYQTTFSQTLSGDSRVTTVTDPGNKTTTYTQDNTTGNLTKLVDGANDTWNYQWMNNNLTQFQDAKGTTTYSYDSYGNVIAKVTSVDSNPSDNITETMTYDTYNQLLSYTDGSGRTTSYQYSNEGNLLSTSNPDVLESNGHLYDQYGNVIQDSPAVMGTHNLLANGSMEIAGTGGALLADWTRSQGAATASQDSSWAPHGNYSLKITSGTVTTDTFSQTVSGVSAGDPLTLRADVNLSGVHSSGSSAGVIVELSFPGSSYNNAWYCSGTGTRSIVVTAQEPTGCSQVTVTIGLANADGTAWFDGVQLQDPGSNSSYVLSAFNSVENNGFENGLTGWTTTAGTPTVTTSAHWEGSSSLMMQAPGTVYQNVPTHGNEPLTFSGMVKASGLNGQAYYKIDYYDSNNNLISGIQTGYVQGTQDWTRLAAIATAPYNAKYAKVQLVATGSGTVYFDDVKLIPKNSISYTYDSGGNYMLSASDALNNQTQNTYDSVGNLTSSSNPLGHTTNYSYDTLNRLSQVTDPLGSTAYYQYDAVGNMTASRDPRSSFVSDDVYRTSYAFSALNKISTLTDSLGNNASYSYDASGNLTGVTLPNGTSETLSYDNANRLSKVALSTGQSYTYTYDGAGEVTGITDQTGANCAWSYDGAHRVTGTTDPLGYSLSYGWDKSDNLTSISNSDYGNLQYTYNGDNKLVSITLPDGNAIYYAYDENGRPFLVQYPGTNNDREMTYAQNGWLTEINDTAFSGQPCYNYYYNNDGTISYETSWAGTDNFGYDKDGRLTYWNISGSTNSGQTSHTYNPANEITDPGFTYDKNGNLTCDGTYNYTYNALNELLQVNKVSGALVATLTYNQDGTRRSKTTSQGTTNYDWDAFGNLVKENGPNGTYYYYYGPSGGLVAVKANGTTYIIHANKRGDIEAVTNESGSVVAQSHYDPWGNQTSHSGSITLPFGYAGYYYDSETGLYYCKSRYYSPELERFITRDSTAYISLGNPQTLDLYSYCNNDPVNMVDPSGKDTETDEDIEECREVENHVPAGSWNGVGPVASAPSVTTVVASSGGHSVGNDTSGSTSNRGPSSSVGAGTESIAGNASANAPVASSSASPFTSASTNAFATASVSTSGKSGLHINGLELVGGIIEAAHGMAYIGLAGAALEGGITIPFIIPLGVMAAGCFVVSAYEFYRAFNE